MLEVLIRTLKRVVELSPEEIAAAVAGIVDPAISPAVKAEFLAAFAEKGETVNEISGFALALRQRALEPPIDPALREREIVDVCGTGGDRLGTFNISTTVALVLAAAGVTVAKHGNRAISSASGSADVLEELGIPIALSPDEAVDALRNEQFAFFFAPKYHPAFQHIAPARKLCAERGQRTIFNLLGPLLNPARPSAQLVGVPNPRWCDPFARVLQSMGVRRAMVVCGSVPFTSTAASTAAELRFLDELSTMGASTIAEFYQANGFSRSVLAPENFPFQPVTLEDLAGGDRKANAWILGRLLAGEERGAKRDAVLLNAAAGLLVAGRSRSLTEGWELAAEVIDSGKARRKLKRLARAG